MKNTMIEQPNKTYSTFLSLNDTPNSYSGQSGKSVTVKATEDGLEFNTTTTTDEKVKYDVSDPTAGYIADKFVAGSGISLAEGTSGNENKLVISNSGVVTETDPLSLHLDQTTPQTITNGAPYFLDGIKTNLIYYDTGAILYYDGGIYDYSNNKVIELNNRELIGTDGSTQMFSWYNGLYFPTLTNNGFLKTSNSNGTITVDTNSYLTTVDDDFGLVIINPSSTGEKARKVITTAGTIIKWGVTTKNGETGSAVIDIKKNGVSIIGTGNKPTISGTDNNSANASGWTNVSVAVGDILEYFLESVSGITWLSLTVGYSKT